MSTIAHPRSVPSGPSGKTVAGVLVGAVLAVAVGYGVVTLGEPQPVGSGADQVMTQKAALARTERMIEINETWPVPSETFGGDAAWDSRAEFLRIQHATQAQNGQWDSKIEYLGKQWNAQNGLLYGADQAALARTERMLEINELGYDASISGRVTEEARRRGERMFEINSFGWEPAKLESGGPKSPLTVE